MLVLSFFLPYGKTLQKPILALLSLVLRPISGKKMLQSSQRLTATLFFIVFRIPFLHFSKFWCSSGVISTHQMLQTRINTGFICLMTSSSGADSRFFIALCKSLYVCFSGFSFRPIFYKSMYLFVSGRKSVVSWS